MRGKSLALLILALGCGLVASIGITQVLAKRGNDQPAQAGESQTIFVALEDIAMGDPLHAQMLQLEEWPKDKVPEGALTNIEDIEGRLARAKIYTGEPILDRKLLRKGESSGGGHILIPKGMRVVSVRVDKVSGGAGLILPGNRVDVVVYLTKCAQKGIPDTSTRVVLQDIKVFAVNDQYRSDPEESGKSTITNAQTVSLLVTPDQGQKLMLASELGKVRLVLRSPEDDTESEHVMATAQDILGGSDKADRDEETLLDEPDADGSKADGMADFLDFLNQAKDAGQANAQPSQTPAGTPQTPTGPVQPDNATWNMRIVRAGDVQEVTLEESRDPSTGKSVWRDAGGGYMSPGSMVPGGAPATGTTPDGYQPFTPPTPSGGSADAPPAGGAPAAPATDPDSDPAAPYGPDETDPDGADPDA